MTIADHRAGRREWVGLAVLTLPALLAAMDLSVLFMATPLLSADLQPSGSQLLWIMDIYGFLMAGLLITMGTLGDRIGRRKLLMFGAAAFGAASLLAAYSTSAEMLIAARALLGVGGATLGPSTLALIRNMFHDDAQRRTAVAVWTGAWGGGFPLGAIFGGMLVQHFWWGSVFLINVPVMVLLLVLAPLLLPEYADARPGRFDLLGAGLSMAAVLPVIWGTKELAVDGWAAPPFVAIAAGLAVGYVFVRRNRRRADPLLDLRLFASPAFTASIGANIVLILASAGLGMLFVQQMQLVLGYEPFAVALWMLPMTGFMALGIATSTTLARRVRPGFLVGSGIASAALGLGLLTGLDADDTVGLIVTGYSIFGFGMGLAVTLVYDLVVTAAPPERAGAAAALNETGAEFGGAMGIAVLGSIATAVYRSALDSALPALPAGLPGAAAEAARGTLGGAIAVAGELPEGLRQPLLRAVAESFTQGIATTALVGSALLAVTAVAATHALRKVPAHAS